MAQFLVCRGHLKHIGAREEGRVAAWGVLGHGPCLVFGEVGPLVRGKLRHRKLGPMSLRAFFAFWRF